MDAAPFDRREVASVTDVGNGVRPRPAFVSGTAVFIVGDDSHDDAVVGHLSDDAGLDDAPATCSRSDRRRGAVRRSVHAQLHDGLNRPIGRQFFFSSSASITMMPLGPRRYVSL